MIANPKADRGRTGRNLAGLADALRGFLGDIEITCTRSAGDAVQLAREAAQARRPLLVSIGGDGTLSEIVAGLMENEGQAAGAAGLPLLGIVAAGTGGDFGRCLGIGRNVRDYLDVVSMGKERAVDVGRARFRDRMGRPTSRAWINVLSAGIGGLVDEYASRVPRFVPNSVTYAQATLQGIALCRRARLRCRMVRPDGGEEERVIHSFAVAVCNGTTFGAGMRIAPKARPDDGLLDVVSFETPTRLQLVRRFGTIYDGSHLDQQGVRHFTCRSLLLEPIRGPLLQLDRRTPAPEWRGGQGRLHVRDLEFPLDVDGDALGDVPLEVNVLPLALRVCAPPQAAG